MMCCDCKRMSRGVLQISVGVEHGVPTGRNGMRERAFEVLYQIR